jgi:hypothetical protein
MRIDEIDRRGFLGQLGRAAGAAAVTAAVPGIALAGPSEPIVDSNDPRVVEQALKNLELERQKLLRMQQILKNPTPEMRTWTPARLQNTIDRVENDLKINAAMTRRGQEQLQRLQGKSSTGQNRDPAMRREIDRLRADQDRMRGNWSQVRNAAQSLGLDPNKVRGKFDGQGNLVAIIDERNGREIAVSRR